MVREFLAASHCEVRTACFAVAGPVIDGRAHLTNLPWTVDAAALRAELALDEVFLLNDLQATAYAAPRLRARGTTHHQHRQARCDRTHCGDRSWDWLG